MRSGSTRATLRCSAAAVALLSSGFASAQERTFDFPSEDAVKAIPEFARQAGIQIVAPGDQLKGVTTPAVHGALDVHEALKELLASTGIEIASDDGQTIVLRAKAKSGDAAFEQRADPSAGSIEQVVVTAEKREERLIDVPISMVVLGALDLKKREINTLDDLRFNVPGLSLWSNGVYNYFFLRGISNVQGNGALASEYVDEADITMSPQYELAFDLYDLDHVEVLRGPQGTLYGEGSEGGTIRFLTKKPVLDRYGFDADFAAMFSDHGAPGQRIDAALNIPLIDNELGVRVAGDFDREGGWINQPAANLRDINGQDKVNVRTRVLWQPSDKLTVSAMAQIYSNDGAPSHDEDGNGNFTQSFGQLTTPALRDRTQIYNLTVAYDFDGMRLLSTTSAVRRDLHVVNEAFTFPSGPPPSSPQYELLYPDRRAPESSLTEEVRLSSTESGPWQWTIGAIRQHVVSDLIFTYYFTLPAPTLPSTLNNFTTEGNSLNWAVFGDTNYEILKGLTLGVGMRYFEDEESTPQGQFQDLQFGTFHSLDPRFYAKYQLTDEIQLYASAAKGFRTGGFNGIGQPNFAPEKVWTYEIGSKLFSQDSEISADGDLFYSDYTNYQLQGIPPTAANPAYGVLNASAAIIDGLEWDIQWHPLEKWTLGVNGDYLLEYKFTNVDLLGGAYVTDDLISYVYKYQIQASLEREFTVSGRTGFARFDYSVLGPANEVDRAVGPWFNYNTKVIGVLNFKASLQWNDNLRLGVFAENLFNQRGYLNPDFVGGDAERAHPRYFGFEASVNFD